MLRGLKLKFWLQETCLTLERSTHQTEVIDYELLQPLVTVLP
jgi:hypothetical protein